MKEIRRLCRGIVAALLIAAATTSPALARSPEQEILQTVRGFYNWALKNGERTATLEPRVGDISATKKVELDLSTLDEFTGGFMRSGSFAPGFPGAVSRYYKRHAAGFKALSQKEIDDMVRDGPGPMMETEDMDLFFCAQEYEYKKDFVQGMKIKSAKIGAHTATAVVISPYDWETTFQFVKVKGRWLISGYCVYQ